MHSLLLSLSTVILVSYAEIQDSRYLLHGENLTLSCKSSDKTRWLFNNVDVNSDDRNDLKLDGYDLPVTTFTRSFMEANDSGQYECRIGDEKLMEVQVNVIKISGTSFSLEEETKSGQNSTADASLSCSVENLPAGTVASSISWTRNGSVLTNTEKYEISNSTNMAGLKVMQPESKDAGYYTCHVALALANATQVFTQNFSINVAPKVAEIGKIRNRVEDEVATIECNATGFPVPTISWYRRSEEPGSVDVLVTYDDRVNATLNSANVPGAKLIIKALTIKQDRGYYTCVATNELGQSNSTALLKIKDKLAAVWPFLGICAEVVILCAVIFIFEKRRTRRLEEEEEVDAVKQELMNSANGTDKEVRQRNAVAKA